MFRAVSLLGRLGTLQVIADVKKPLTERPEFSRKYSGSLLTRKIRIQKPTTKRTFYLPKNDCNKRAILTRNCTTDKAVSASPAVGSLHQILAEALKGINPDPYSSLPKPNLPFDSDSYIGNIFQLTKAFVNSNRFRDEKSARVAVLTGISGIGKTQFSMELPYLLRQACEYPNRLNYLNTDGLQTLAPPSGAPVNHRSASRLMSEEMSDKLAEETFEDKVQSLKEALSKNCKRIYIDWSNTGQSYDNRIEQNWSSSVMLGLRVAAQHWFPNINFSVVRDRMENSPHLDKFTLTNVLNAMHSKEETLSAVYIILDGFHATTRWEAPSKSDKETELLSQGLSRALISAARAQEKFFVFGTISATSITNGDIVPDDAFIYAPVPRLSNRSVKNIILRSELFCTKPADWLALEGFDVVLKLVAGIPRSVQILVEKMELFRTIPSNVLLADILFERYKHINNIDCLFGSRSSQAWPLLLGVSGYNVAPLKMIQVNHIEKKGYFSRVESPWRSIWLKCHAAVRPSDPMLVMDIPLPTLQAFSWHGYFTEIHCPDTAYTFPRAEANYLTSLLGMLTDAAYSNIDKSILIHLLLRWNVFNFADNSNCIFAADLFVGGLFDRTFGARRFAKEKTVIGLPYHPLKGVWATTTKAPSVPSSVVLENLQVIKFSDMSPDKRGVFFGGDNLFSGHLRLWIEEGDKQLPAIIWLDTKHATSNTELTLKDVDEVVKKRKFLEQKLPPYIHLSIIYSNHNYSGDEPEDSNTCIVSKEGMAFSMSPMMKWLLTENRQP